MHEFSICQHLFQLIHQHAKQRRVRRVHVAIGALAAIDQAALRFAFDVAKAAAHLADAELLIATVAAPAHCSQCGVHTTVSNLLAICSACGAPLTVAVDDTTTALQLVNIEVEPCVDTAVVVHHS